jgi:hypothetical protein
MNFTYSFKAHTTKTKEELHWERYHEEFFAHEEQKESK